MPRNLFSREREQPHGKGLKAGKCSVSLRSCHTYAVAGQSGNGHQMRQGRASPKARVRLLGAILTAMEVAGVNKGFFLHETREWTGRCKRTLDSAASGGFGLSFRIFFKEQCILVVAYVI